MEPFRGTVGEYVAQFLAAQQIPHLFELVSSYTAPLLEAVARLGATAVVSVRHEQAAGFAAEAQARMLHRPAVALTTGGPGALNAINAVASCYFDSVPMVMFVGQTFSTQLKGSRPVRQLGFQEVDVLAMARPVTKATFQVLTAAELPTQLREAFAIAQEGRPGPVVVELPFDVQQHRIEAPPPEPVARSVESSYLGGAATDLIGWLSQARRPLAVLGGGVRAAGAAELCRKTLRRLSIPVVTSLLGLDACAHDDPLRVGMIGICGNRRANLAVRDADLLLVLGSRLDVRQTGVNAAPFSANRRIVHVDCDPGEVNNRVTGAVPVIADVRHFLEALAEVAPKEPANQWKEWHAELDALRRQWPDERDVADPPGLNPNVLLQRLGQASAAASSFSLDVGQNQMWAAQSLWFHSRQRVLTSGGLGCMGFAVPAAIGAAFTEPGKPAVAIIGDGGFQMNIQELQTIVHHRLPVKMVLLDNGSHGLVRQFQHKHFGSKRPVGSLEGYSAPDFVAVAEAFGVPAQRLTCEQYRAQGDAAIGPALQWLWSDPDRPALLVVELITETASYVAPTASVLD